jgi:hypothetical protein
MNADSPAPSTIIHLIIDLFRSWSDMKSMRSWLNGMKIKKISELLILSQCLIVRKISVKSTSMEKVFKFSKKN